MRQQRFQVLPGSPQIPQQDFHAGRGEFDLQPAGAVHPAVGLWTRREVAGYLRISVRSLDNLRQAGRLVPHRELRGLYVPEEVEAFRLQRHTRTTLRRSA